MGLEPKEFLFLSDVEEELNAARDAGMNTIKLDRYDSMEPFIKNGEYVIIERTHVARNYEIVIAVVDGEVDV